MKALILAGGSGTRLWPLSRETYPKHFLRLNGAKSFLQQTVERIAQILPFENIFILTNKQYKFHVLSELREISSAFENQILFEPAMRNTAPAIALGIRYLLEKQSATANEVLLVLPSDHILRPEGKFAHYIRQAHEIAQRGYLVTFGVNPLYPETGFGYIKVKGQDQGGYFLVDKFTEKPDLETAKQFLIDGKYFWNSGMFAFTIGAMTEELKQYAPEIYELFDQPLDDMIACYHNMPDISIDYAVMEKSKKVATIPMDIYWSDIGSWDSVYDMLEKDESGNAVLGDVFTKDAKNSLIIGDKRLIAIFDVEDLVVVETDDAILIGKRGSTQKVKHVVEELKVQKRREALEHRTVYRPWGRYTVLEEGSRYKIKRIVVNPRTKLSLQMHYHCSEHWIVVKGTAKVAIGDKVMFIHENESVFVPRSTPHRLENPGKIPLEIIEIQSGEYLEEGDIVRIEDDYGRKVECPEK